MNPSNRKKVLVTGATSGIGAATAKALLRAGFDVAVLGRRTAELEKISLWGATAGGETLALPCDLANREATDAAIARLRSEWPALYGIVLNAAANAPTTLDAPDTNAFDRIIEVNLTSCLRLVRGLLDFTSDGGRIVAVASILGRLGIPAYHGYCASKAGLIGFVRALALELAPRHITVNAIAPGWVDTDMATESMAAQAPVMGMSTDEAREVFVGAVPLGRMLRPGEVASTILNLLRPSAAGMTGQAVNLDCGFLA